jgi:Pyridoxal-phosphate dependent enzyme
MEWQVPTLADVLEARRRILRHLRPTPLFGYAGLDELLGAEVLVRQEDHQPTGAFKVRGGVNLVSQLSAEERERGVIAASTGNHGHRRVRRDLGDQQVGHRCAESPTRVASAPSGVLWTLPIPGFSTALST